MSEQTPEWVVAQRRELVGFLEGLSTEQWNAPTLCDGWRVREVIAHITMPYRYSAPRFVVEMVKSRGNFNKMSNRRALATRRKSVSNNCLPRFATTLHTRGSRRVVASRVHSRTT